MNEVLKRSLTGLVFIAVVMCAIWFHPMAAAVLFGLLAVIGTFEYARMVGTERPGYLLGIASIAGGCVYIAAAVWQSAFLIFFALPGLLMALNYLRKTPNQSVFFEFVFPILYVCVGFSLIPSLLTFFPSGKGAEVMTGFFILLWTNDTMAYVTGRIFGRTKLFERLSPKKTIEGFAGGLLFAAVAGWGIYEGTKLFSLVDWLALAAIVSIFGTLGDLIESGIKRMAGVKDSGTILPGHGGVLDRFDGLFLSLPLFFGYIYLTYPNGI